jgi:hypothetical protein
MTTATPTPEHDPAGPDRRRWVCAAVFGLVAVYYAVLTMTRRIDGDEGYFVYAAQLAMSGKVPYKDFFFPQMPLTPYLFGVPWLVGAGGWIGARLWVAVLAAAAAMVFWRMAWLMTRSQAAALLLLAVYLTGDFGLQWATVAKSLLPAGGLALAAGWALLEAERGYRTRGMLALSGLFFGLATLSRLTTLPICAVLGLYVLLVEPPGGPSRGRRVALWAAGVAPCVAVASIFFAVAPERFIFQNLGYHLIDQADPADGGTRMMFMLQAVAQWRWLVALALAGVGLAAMRGRPQGAVWLMLGVAAVFIAVSLAPSRVFLQYFALATPWLLLAAGAGLTHPKLAGWLDRWPGRDAAKAPVRLVAGFAVCLLLTLATSWPALRERWIFHWEKDSGPGAQVAEDRLGHVRYIARQVNAHMPESGRWATWWPGYAVGVESRLLPGLENHFALRVNHYEGDERAGRAGSIPVPWERLIREPGEGRPDLVLAGIWTGEEDWKGRNFYVELLETEGWRHAGTYGTTRLYLRPGTRSEGGGAQ